MGAVTPALLQRVIAGFAQSSHVPSPSEEDLLGAMVGAARDGGHVLLPAPFSTDPVKGLELLAGAE